MKRLWRSILSRTVCRFFGHTTPIWRPFFVPWSGGWITESGQCMRCWLVIAERKVYAKGPGPDWHGKSPVVHISEIGDWPWE